VIVNLKENTMSTKEDCQCSTAPKLIFPCSGAADVGAIADQAGRKLSREGIGNMFCLAGIGGGVSGIIESAKAASGILAIDGCPIDCAKKTLEKAGIKGFTHLRVTDHGLTKGKSAVTDESVTGIAELGAALLAE
jgi:uncharacterized metal-binding protein